MIIINNGQLVAHLRAGVEFEEFRSAITRALSNPEALGAAASLHDSGPNDDEAAAGQSSIEPQTLSNTTGTNSPDVSAAEATSTSHSTTPGSSIAQTHTTTSAPATSNLQQVMGDRRRRLQADKAIKDAAEKENRKAVAQARHEAANATPGTPVSNQSLYAQELRKRKQEAKEERERILKAIESDKAERKEREAQRRALTEAEATEAAKGVDEGKESTSSDHGRPPHWSGTPYPQHCSLQVRLFDGTTIRSKFAPDQTLGNAVRTWIAEQRTDGDTPFTLKQILTPLPNKTITISEEEESLQSLGLLPSATLVMVPIQGYTGAYANDQGLIGKAVSAAYNAATAGGTLLKGGLRAISRFGRATGGTQEAVAEEQHDSDTSEGEPPAATAAGAKFRTLRRQQDRDTNHPLYNGNQVQEALLCK
ncbi:MAG: hypothetical protein LQ338_005164 [Usnochroma carphineum]|nr:MAG: hypothetical protein LQ338_005164 [Usnochroma carphineum]